MQASADDQGSKCFAFVDYDSHESAVAACQALHEKEMEGCKLYVARAQTKAERQGILQRKFEQQRSQMSQQMEGKNVYVKNLAPSVDEEQLKTAFSVRKHLFRQHGCALQHCRFACLYVCFTLQNCAEVRRNR